MPLAFPLVPSLLIATNAAVYDDGQNQKNENKAPTKDNITYKFFEREYQLDYLIATLGKPHVSLLNGITSSVPPGLAAET